jgi:hypothetical protein
MAENATEEKKVGDDKKEEKFREGNAGDKEWK